MIKDVQPSVFCVIQDAFDAASKPFTAYYNKAVSEMISKIKDLKTIYFMNPIKLKGGGPVQYQKLLWLYEAIFTRSKINKDVVFKNISEVFQIIVREKRRLQCFFIKERIFCFQNY